MGKMVNIGFGNLVHSDKIVTIVNPDSAPMKRLIQKAKEMGTLVDETQGRRTKSILLTTNGLVILSALQPETIAGRFHQNQEGKEGK